VLAYVDDKSFDSVQEIWPCSVSIVELDEDQATVLG
jgi:hypothetical protein